jgi:tetratricopeptide (TPR) repeat protein
MRKFFAFIFAIILALLAVTGVLLYKQGADFREVNTDKVIRVWTSVLNIKTDGEKPKTGIIQVNTPQPEQEENLTYDERIKKGDYYFDRGFLTFALNEYVKAADLEPTRAEPYIRLLKTNYELGYYEKALSNTEAILRMKPGDFETELTLALVYIKQSDFAKAQTLLTKLSASDIRDARVPYYLGLIQIAMEDHDGGKKYLKQAKSANTDPKLGEKIDTMLSAYTEYEFAKSADGLYLSELLAKGYNKIGEYEMAVYKLKDILKKRSDLRDAWVLFGYAYLSLEKYNFALSAFERAYQLDSEWPATQYFVGLTQAELGNTKEAIIYLNYALSNNFEPALAVYQKLADLYLETKDYAKAVESYKKILEINNKDINSFVRPVWIYLDYLNQPDKAIEIAKTAVTAFPESAMSYNLLGWSQIGIKDYADAETNLKKAIELDAGLAAAYYNLGQLYEIRKMNDKALGNYQKAYELDQNGSIGNLAAKSYNGLLTQ